MSRGIFYVASHTPLHVFGRALKHGQYDPRTASPTIGRADSAAACSRDVDSYSSHPISRRGVEEAAPAGDLAVLYREYMRPRCLPRPAGLARGRAPPAAHGDVLPRLDELLRLEAVYVVCARDRCEKIGHFLMITAPARIRQIRRADELPNDKHNNQFQDLCHITSTERLIGLLHNGGRCSHVHLPIGMAVCCLLLFLLGVLVWLFCVCFVFCCVFLVFVCCLFFCVCVLCLLVV